MFRHVDPSSPPSDHGQHPLLATLQVAAAALVALSYSTAAPASAQQAHQLCKPGHHYDQSRGLCYDPAAAYKADIPKAPEGSDGFLSGFGSSLGLGSMLSLCQYGDKHVGSGDQAYCVSRRTGEAYPATR